jgi:hypothetical protein
MKRFKLASPKSDYEKTVVLELVEDRDIRGLFSQDCDLFRDWSIQPTFVYFYQDLVEI